MIDVANNRGNFALTDQRKFPFGATVTVLLATILVVAADALVPQLQGVFLLFCQIFLAICSVLLAALWVQRRHRHEYGWLALLAAAWVVFLFFNHASQAFESAPALALLVAGLSLGFLQQLASRPLLKRHHWWLLVAALVVVSVLARGLLSESYSGIAAVVSLCSWLALALICQRALSIGLSQGGFSRWSTAACFTTLVLTLLAVLGALTETPIHPRIVAYAAVVFVGIFCWLLLSEFIDSVRHTEALNVKLDQKVREKTEELTEQHRQIQAMQRAQVLAGERERIMREMHDGVGGQLVSTLAMVDGEACSQQALRDALGEALTDMRLMVDSLAPVGSDLNAVLATFRERMQPRLDAAGVELRWQVNPIPRVAELGPAGVLCVLRILQETMTNALKHAQSNELVVATELTENGEACIISVADNGVGFELGKTGAGYGMTNMQQRADEQGFIFVMQSTKGTGSRMTLQIPVDANSASEGRERH